jgi:acyl carrier protein
LASAGLVPSVNVMTDTTMDYFAIVRAALAEAVGIDEDEVKPTSTIVGDLEAESIDLLDALFRIERLAGVKIQATEITDLLLGELSAEEFEGPDGMVTDAGLDQLQRVLPQIDKHEFRGKLAADDVMGLLTVENLASMVARRLAAADAG